MKDDHFTIGAAFAMAAGQDMDEFYDVQIDECDKRSVRDALENIFQGSSIILWVRGGTLRDAWNTTLDNMRDEFFATSRRDILTIFLQRAVFEQRTKWTEKMRVNSNRAQTFDMLHLSQSDTTKMLNQAEFQKQQGYDTIKQIFEKYDNGFKPTQKPQKINSNVAMREHIYEREEHVRERTK